MSDSVNPLTRDVCKILNFNPEKPSEVDIAKNEAISKEKLVSTWCFVNGKLAYIRELHLESNLVKLQYPDMGDTQKIQVEEFVPWNPETGLYNIPGEGLVFLAKLAHKSWKKSFYDSNYSIIFLNMRTVFDVFLYKDLSTSKVQDIGIDINNIIYFRNIKIGELTTENIIKCTSHRFYQELLDFVRKENLTCPVIMN